VLAHLRIQEIALRDELGNKGSLVLHQYYANGLGGHTLTALLGYSLCSLGKQARNGPQWEVAQQTAAAAFFS
jgi:hypothetical protein